MTFPFIPGDRVIVFDHRLWEDDKSTPPEKTFKPATVVCHYGCKSMMGHWNYPSLIDIRFDHRPSQVSRGHFTDYVEYL